VELLHQTQKQTELVVAVIYRGVLSAPPGNRLEALKGERAGQYSIRVNDQWRVCFTWREGGPADVKIVDYH
jgi:toxin HigB-1